MAKAKAKPKTAESTTSYTCAGCGVVGYPPAGRCVLPNKWKKRIGMILCADCLKKHVEMRALSLRISKPVCIQIGKDTRELKWDELELRLRCMQVLASDLANRAVHTMLGAEDLTDMQDRRPKAARLESEKAKPHRWAAPDLYGVLVRASATAKGPASPLADYFEGVAGDICCLLQLVQAKYAKERFSVFGKAERRVATYTQEKVRWRVHNRNWDAHYARPELAGLRNKDAHEMRVTFPVPALDTRWPWVPDSIRQKYRDNPVLPAGKVTVVVTGGKDAWRHRAEFDRLATGQADRSELTISRKKMGSDGGRHAGTDRENGGGMRRSTRWMINFCFTAKRKEEAKEGGVLYVKTWPGKDAEGNRTPFLSATLTESIEQGFRELEWVEHAEHLVRISTAERRFRAIGRLAPGVSPERMRQTCDAYDRRRQALANDMRWEKRVPRSKRRQMVDRGAVWAEKNKQRLDTFLWQMCASIVAYAKRRGAALVQYDDTDRGYFKHFPWAMFVTRMKHSCMKAGMQFLHVGKTASAAAEEGDESVEANTEHEATPKPAVKKAANKPKPSGSAKGKKGKPAQKRDRNG